MDIVILHGWGSSPTRWEKTRKALEKTHRVYCPHLPGFDPQKPLSSPWKIEDYHLWLENYLSQNHLSRPTILAHSHGGRLALSFTAQHPEQLSHLILIGSAGLPPRNSLKRMIFFLPAKFGKAIFSLPPLQKLSPFFRKILYRLTREKDYFEASPVMRETMKNMLSLDLTEAAQKISIPTLLLWGRRDTYTPLWMGQKLARLIPTSHLIIFSSGRHGLHLTHPQKIANKVESFLKKTKANRI